MRLALPGALVPSVSALERLEEGGQLRGLHAGANVLTINFTPPKTKDKYLIYGKDRYVVRVEHVRRVLSKAGLQHPILRSA